MLHLHHRLYRAAIFLSLLLLSALLFSACGGFSNSSSGSSTTSAPNYRSINSSASGQSQSQNPVSSQSKSADQNQKLSNTSASDLGGPPYLIKSLTVNMAVKDTQKTATDLQNWLQTADPRSTSAGISYDQIDDSHFSVSLTYSVSATAYDQVRSYLTSYPAQQQGRLLNLHENVQDVTNDYVDTQSRISNLRVEQKRLQTILSSAQSVTDIINVEQRLADVEGQIEEITGHLKSLQSQTTYYTVVINLQPLSLVPAAQPQPGWNAGQVLHDAWGTSLAFGQVLLTILLWLLSFSPYIVVVGGIAVWWWWRKRRGIIATPVVSAAPPPASGSTI